MIMLPASCSVLVAGILERADVRGRPYAPGDPSPRAVVASAFGCFIAAQWAWLENDNPAATFAEALDAAMAAVQPTANESSTSA
ncbi:hypothetical protein AB6813_12415 [bacterium RCC_150]